MAQIMLRDYLQQTEDALSSGRIDDAIQKTWSPTVIVL